MIDRAKGRFISPIRLKNKNRSPSPSTQSIASSTPTHSSYSYSHHHQQRHHSRNKFVSNVFDCDVDVDKEEVVNKGDDDNVKYNSIAAVAVVIENTCSAKNKISKNSASHSYRNELSRTIGGYSVPYRGEKRNPLNHTRLSCYKPLSIFNSENHPPPSSPSPSSHLKNYKSVEDFLSMDNTESSSSTASSSLERNNFDDDTHSLKLLDSMQKNKRRGFSSKFRSMSDKTQKLFSKFYSSTSNLKPSTEISNDFTIIQPKKSQPLPPPTSSSSSSSSSSSVVSHSRRSLSYGMLPDLKDRDYEVKKIETEDGDSGILVNESGASSMIETENENEKMLIKSCNGQAPSSLLVQIKNDEKFIQR